jgi:hypothetical protein
MAVDLAWRSLWHDRLRFFITVAGVAFAVTLVFVQVGLFIGILDNATVTIDHMGADLWVHLAQYAQRRFRAYLSRVVRRSRPFVARRRAR